MTFLRSTTKPFRMLALLTAAAGTLCACTPEPAPTPTPTAAFATQEEAFAAAEDVYRAYTDALNDQRAGDSSSDPLQYLMGVALEEHLESERDLAARELEILGNTVLETFIPVDAQLDTSPMKLTGVACLDISGTRVVDVEGTDLTPVDRSPNAALMIELLSVGNTFSISNSTLAKDQPC